MRLIVEIDKQFKPIEPKGDSGDFQQVPTPMTYASEHGSAIDVGAQHRELRGAVADRLREEIQAMSVDNFIVRPKRRYVEKFAEPKIWSKLGANESAELVDHVAGLPSALEDDDLAAKEFDLLILRTQLALLRAEPAFRRPSGQDHRHRRPA